MDNRKKTNTHTNRGRMVAIDSLARLGRGLRGYMSAKKLDHRMESVFIGGTGDEPSSHWLEIRSAERITPAGVDDLGLVLPRRPNYPRRN